ILIFSELKNNSKTSAERSQTLNGVSLNFTYFSVQKPLNFHVIFCALHIFHLQLVFSECLMHTFATLLFLVSGKWVPLLVNIPLFLYHIKKYKNRPATSGLGMYDPLCLTKLDIVLKGLIEAGIKLAFYIFCFFYYLHGMVLSLVEP
ncbi:unnamed protein product, partial [Darwinula stevensoni]